MNENNGLAPKRGMQHDALAVFLGSWTASGTSYGGESQSISDPKAAGAPWTSTHVAQWHTGEFFLIQDERARPGGIVFDTISIIGVDERTGKYFAHCFENHGHYRRYDVENNGRLWTFAGESERATITFSADGMTQNIVWEWRPKMMWLPLCDRVAVRTSGPRDETAA
jgi:hypothetical protein